MNIDEKAERKACAEWAKLKSSAEPDFKSACYLWVEAAWLARARQPARIKRAELSKRLTCCPDHDPVEDDSDFIDHNTFGELIAILRALGVEVVE